MVSEVNFEEHKLTLSPPADLDDGAWKAHAAMSGAKPGASAKSIGMGTFADLFGAAGASTSSAAATKGAKSKKN